MSDHVIGCFAVAFRLCCRPGPLQFLLGVLGRLREGETVRHDGERYGYAANATPPLTYHGGLSHTWLLAWEGFLSPGKVYTSHAQSLVASCVRLTLSLEALRALWDF